MAAPKKNETRKQKRDPNQPVPKRPKKKTLVLKVLLLGALLLVGVWGGLYSVQLGRGPWGWSGEDWSGFATFSQEQVSEAASNASESARRLQAASRSPASPSTPACSGSSASTSRA